MDIQFTVDSSGRVVVSGMLVHGDVQSEVFTKRVWPYVGQDRERRDVPRALGAIDAWFGHLADSLRGPWTEASVCTPEFHNTLRSALALPDGVRPEVRYVLATEGSL